MNVFSSNSFSRIKNCYFQLLSSPYGGAIFIDDLNYDVTLQFCIFDTCSSTAAKETTSSGMKNLASGGSCLFDIKNINISNVYTTKCKTPYYGHAIFVLYH